MFRAAGYRLGYAVGFASVGYYEGAAIADSMKAVASDTVLVRAGLVPDSGRHGLWTCRPLQPDPGQGTGKYGSGRALDTMKLPVFSEHEQAPVGRFYRGGSSGRLRREFHILPPGDIRNCIAALSEDESLLLRLFEYRFAGNGTLYGSSLLYNSKSNVRTL